jgi:hypothetical protein
MLQLFYLKSQEKRAADLLQSRLARQITVWVFSGIVAIESVIFVPSYLRRQAENLRSLEAISQEVLSTIQLSMISHDPEQAIFDSIQITEHSVIQGLAVYDTEGQLIYSLGDMPDLSSATLTQSRAMGTIGSLLSSWPLISNVLKTEAPVIRKLSAQGNRYDYRRQERQ